MLFLSRDLETDDEGEILVERGDFVLATSQRTAMQLVNFVALNSFNDYLPKPQVAGNAGEFLGHPNIARTHSLMISNMRSGLRAQNAFNDGAIRIVAEPVELNVVALLIQMHLSFDVAPEDDSYGTPILAYKVPLDGNQIEAVPVE